MRYLHSMVRIRDVDASLRFYCEGLGLREVRRIENEQGKFTLIFLAAPDSPDAEVEMTTIGSQAGD
jgi:lactoylglutathione lyase